MKSRFFTVIATAAIALALVVAPAQAVATTSPVATSTTLAASVKAAPSAPLNIVALGDSYASGVGAGGYEPGTNVPGGCYRSANSYSELAVAQLRAAGKQVNFTNVTCSGATTFDVLQTQLGALTVDTTHVLLTVGGNNLRFSDFAGLCIAAECSGIPSSAMDGLIARMAVDLSALLDEIKQWAPRAQIIMVGYGQLVTRSATTPSTADPICGSFSAAERNTPGQFPANDVNDVSTHLDLALFGTSLAHGAYYISPYWVPGALRSTFAGHSLCDVKESWYHGFNAPDGQIAVLHPTPKWQSAIATLTQKTVALAG